MKLVAATQADTLCRAVTAESWGDGNLAIGHEDATISVYDKQNVLQLVWLNPGEEIISLTAVDVNLMACFSSGTIRLLSMETGLQTAEALLPCAITGVHVLEHYLACWSRFSTKVWFLQRSNLDVWQCLETDSLPLNIFAVPKGLSLVCSSDVYLLKLRDDSEYHLQKLSHLDTPHVGATSVSHRWLLVRPYGWSLFSFSDASQMLDEEFKVESPDGALFTKVTYTPLGAFLQCSTGVLVLVKDSNIQILDPPKQSLGFLTDNAQIVWPNLTINEAYNQRGEVKWREYSLPVTLTSTKFLVGSSDPSITAIEGKNVGFEDGRVNDVMVLPGPILALDAGFAHSTAGSVALPLQEVNVIVPPKDPQKLRDSRVSVQICSYNSQKTLWAGIEAPNWTTLRPLSGDIPAPLLALLVLEKHQTVEQILSNTELSLTAVAQLEDLAVSAAALGDNELCSTTASILDKVWTSRRVAELMQSAGPRSLQVLSAVFPYIKIPKGALQSLIVAMLEGPRVDREAVLWVFEHKKALVDDFMIPFSSLKGVSEETVTRFAEKMAISDSSKLLRDAAAATASESASTVHVDETNDSLTEANVMKVLLAALSSPGPPVFPPSDDALASLVALVVPAVHQRVAGAKKILTKLLSQGQVQYHQAKQRLLVSTPSVPNHAGLMFELNDSSHEPIVLLRPSTTGLEKRDAVPEAATLVPQGKFLHRSPMMFSADGKSVYCHVSHQSKMVWHFTGTIRALFKSKQPIEPVLEH